MRCDAKGFKNWLGKLKVLAGVYHLMVYILIP
jgi:hypothetical protein